MEWPVRERSRLSQDGVGFGSAIEASAAGAVCNGDWRCNRLGDPETNEAELGLGRGHVTHMAGLDGGHGWNNARHAMRD